MNFFLFNRTVLGEADSSTSRIEIKIEDNSPENPHSTKE